MLIARRYLLSGRVQGVGFRYYAQEAAVRENVSGYVRNLPDGRVEIRAEGDREAIERFERAVYAGPRGAVIEDVLTEEQPPSGRVTGFHIRH